MPPILGTIISGFLGSGKTSFINRLLQNPHGKRLAVIVNELGEIGLDASLLQGATKTDTFVELDNGCLCCSLNQDLENTLALLQERPNLDHVLIETTGIADPLTVFWTFTRPRLSARYRPNLIVSLVDCLHLDSILATHPIGKLQLEQAHLLLLSKTDLITAAAETTVRDKIRELNPHALVGRTFDSTALSLLLDTVPFTMALSPPVSSAPSHGSFDSVSFPISQPIADIEAIDHFADSLPPSVIRCKGIVPINRESQALAFHKVADEYHHHWLSEPPSSYGIVMIGQHLDYAVLKTLVESLYTHPHP